MPSSLFRYNTVGVLFSSGNSFSTNQNGVSGILEASRIQSSDWAITIPRENIDDLSLVSHQVKLEQSTVEVNLEWLVSNGLTERLGGIVTDGFNSAFLYSNLEKNIFFVYQIDATDFNQTTDHNQRVAAITHCCLKSYSVNASVGQFVRANGTWEGLNVCVDLSGNNNQLPLLNYQDGSLVTGTGFFYTIGNGEINYPSFSPNPSNQISAVKDLVMEFPTGSAFGIQLSGNNSSILQSFSLSFSIDRTIVKPLGYAYPTTRQANLPISIQLSTTAIVSDLQANCLQNYVGCADSGIDMNIKMTIPCATNPAMQYSLRGIKLQNQKFHTAIDGNGFTTAEMSWEGSIGNLFDSGNNLFILATQGNETYKLQSTQVIEGFDNNGDMYFMEESIFAPNIIQNEFFSGIG